MQDSLDISLPERLKVPALPLNGTLVFPYALTPLVIDGESSIRLVAEVAAGAEKLIALFPELPVQENGESVPDLKIPTFRAEEKTLSETGVLGRVVKHVKFPDGTDRVLIRGLSRIRCLAFDAQNHSAEVERIHEESGQDEVEIVAMIKNAVRQFQEIISYSPNFPEELKIAILKLTS